MLGFLRAIALVFAATSVAAAPLPEDVRITHVTIVSPERSVPLENVDVMLHDGRIASIVPSGPTRVALHPTKAAETIDGSGLFLTPGLIDSHVHLGQIPGMTAEQEIEHPEIARAAREQLPRSFLLYGFTTLIDLISTPQQMARWKSHEFVPDTFFCGGAAVMDGYAMNYEPKPERYRNWPYMLMEPGSEAPEGIDPKDHTPEAVVTRMRADGAICVKTLFERGFGGVHDLPVPSLQSIQRVVVAAHAAGIPVLMHANSDEAQAFALDGGVDIMAHGMWNWTQEKSGKLDVTPGVQKILDRIVSEHVGWQPTLQVLHGLTDLFDPAFLDDPAMKRVAPASLIAWYRSNEGQWFARLVAEDVAGPSGGNSPNQPGPLKGPQLRVPIERGRETTAYLLSHGGRILFGTDTPSGPTYANPAGLNGWLEMKRLIAAGETPEQIFRSATIENAKAFHLERDIGTIEVGKQANLLLLPSDPIQSVEPYAHVVSVILNGRVLNAAQLAANAAPPSGDGAH